MLLSDTNRDLFLLALRIWTQFNSGLPLDAADVEALKAKARPGERKLRIDELACAIIERELANRGADAS